MSNIDSDETGYMNTFDTFDTGKLELTEPAGVGRWIIKLQWRKWPISPVPTDFNAGTQLAAPILNHPFSEPQSRFELSNMMRDHPTSESRAEAELRRIAERIALELGKNALDSLLADFASDNQTVAAAREH
ncbi:hypothetical protein DXG01_007666 [Tephrocybe rancida]|nr:hypothetical protein DXG01_007666 [Tephrocybe rancida]